MNNSNLLKARKLLIVGAALTTSLLMPYLSRMPLACVRGSDWFWQYMPDSETIGTLAMLHLFSLKAILIFGIIFVTTKFKWGFYAAAGAHFAATIFFYSHFEEAEAVDASIELLAFPFLIAAVSFLCALIGAAAEILISWRNTRNQLRSGNLYV